VDVEVSSWPERLQGAEAEHADTGPVAEERCGIECHRKSRRSDHAVHVVVVLGTDGALHIAQAVMAPSIERMDPVM
jgi:hypothetical protein